MCVPFIAFSPAGGGLRLPPTLLLAHFDLLPSVPTSSLFDEDVIAAWASACVLCAIVAELRSYLLLSDFNSLALKGGYYVICMEGTAHVRDCFRRLYQSLAYNHLTVLAVYYCANHFHFSFNFCITHSLLLVYIHWMLLSSVLWHFGGQFQKVGKTRFLGDTILFYCFLNTLN